MEALTARQQEILDFIQARIMERAGAPSLMEIGAEFGIPNPNGIRAHLLALEKKGYIQRTPDQARSIRLVPGPGRSTNIITALKKKIWASQRYFVYLPITIVCQTRKGYPFFQEKLAGELERQLRRVCADHDWEILDLKISPDGFTIRLLASPDHSPERMARNLKNSTLALGVRHPFHFHGKNMWAPGFVATTDPQLLDELVAHYRESPQKTGKKGE
jgi:REP element-mobilizing transposase RayT